jgi:hypothetical protein
MLNSLSQLTEHTSTEHIFNFSDQKDLRAFALAGLISELPKKKITTLKLEFLHLDLNLIQILPKSEVTTLDLSYSTIDDKAAKALVKALPKTKITILNLSNARIASGIKGLLNVLPETEITTLNLLSDYISFEEMLNLARVLPKSKVTNLTFCNSINKDTFSSSLKEESMIIESLFSSKVTEVRFPPSIQGLATKAIKIRKCYFLKGAFYGFLMGRHSRLGSDSEVKNLPVDILMEIKKHGLELNQEIEETIVDFCNMFNNRYSFANISKNEIEFYLMRELSSKQHSIQTTKTLSPSVSFFVETPSIIEMPPPSVSFAIETPPSSVNFAIETPSPSVRPTSSLLSRLSKICGTQC